jgi:hypothetical protein
MLKKMMTLLIGMSSVVITQSKQGQTVPAALLVHASRPVSDFTQYLAEMSVPAGVEIRRIDNAWFSQLESNIDRKATVALQEVIQAFNKSHREYQAQLMDGVLVVRPIQRTATFLDQSSTLQRVDVTGVRTALDRVFAQLKPALAGAGGRTGSYLGGAADDFGDQTVISLDGIDRRVIDVLNQIVRQAPRTWLVETSDDDTSARVVRFGMLLPNGKGSIQQLN